MGSSDLRVFNPQAHPGQVCKQLGLCVFNGAQYVSTGIETVVEKESKEGSAVGDSALCTACEMAVVWAQNQLKQKGTKEKVLSYISEFCESLPSPAGGSIVECNSLSSMPNVTFTCRILGDVFMGAYHTVFDIGDLQVGFAEAA